jgi:alpha-2-macroglobulin
VLGGQRQASTSKVSVPAGIAKVQFTREGSLPAYYSINESGFDRNPPTSEISQGLEVIHEFLDAKGNVTRRSRWARSSGCACV